MNPKTDQQEQKLPWLREWHLLLLIFLLAVAIIVYSWRTDNGEPEEPPPETVGETVDDETGMSPIQVSCAA